MPLFGWTVAAALRHSIRVLTLLALIAGWFAGVPSWADAIRVVGVTRSGITLRVEGPVAGVVRMLAPAARVDPGGGMRIVIDRAQGSIRVGDGLSARNDMAKAPRDAGGGSRVAITVPSPGRLPTLPPVEGEAGRPLVVIDAGHGGGDPGAVSPDGLLREKDLTLKVARAIRDALLSSGRVRVAMTRDDDRFLILQERYGIARRLGARLFISVHADSAGNPDATGASVYTLSEVASDKEAARLAARENKADIIAGVDLGDAPPDISSILIDLTQRETMNTSAGFARLLGRESQSLIPTKTAFHRMASLIVLKAPDMPSVLFETGYISNQRDAEFLDSREGRRKVAEGVRRAVEVHFATRMARR